VAIDSGKKWELALKTLTLCGVVVAALWAVYTYQDTKARDYYSEYWNKKADYFLEASNAAATLGTTNKLIEFNEARQTFWRLFYGEMSLVEGSCVKRAMQTFASNVPKSPIKTNQNLPREDLQQPSFKLAIMLRHELATGWEQPFSELDQIKEGTTCQL